MYKYEGLAVGDIVRAQDFEPRPECAPCYIEGAVVEVNVEGTARFQYAHYLVKCRRDVWRGSSVEERSRVGELVAVPMESSRDWNGRVVKLTELKLRVFEDPGHSWMEVPLALLQRLNIAAEISPYSYVRGEFAYLEEDCDAPTFVRAAEAAGNWLNLDWVIRERGMSPIRHYASYQATNVTVGGAS